MPLRRTRKTNLFSRPKHCPGITEIAVREFPKHADSQVFLKNAAFQLHQTTERLYHTLLLTCTFYTSHSHNIENLRKQGRRIDARLVFVWPDDTKDARRRFSLLKEAYVKARYSTLCRTRHNFDYAERHTMPSVRGMPALSRNFAVIGSA
jgi:hypothetical protein